MSVQGLTTTLWYLNDRAEGRRSLEMGADSVIVFSETQGSVEYSFLPQLSISQVAAGAWTWPGLIEDSTPSHILALH